MRIPWAVLALPVLCATAMADWVTTTVATARGPSAVAVNPVTNRIYVVTPGGNSVTVIDGATNETDTVKTKLNAGAVAVKRYR